MDAASATRQPLRLLWLIDSLTLGGAESLVLPFARAIDRHDAELMVCCLKSIGGNPIEERLRDEGVPVVNLGARTLRDLAAFRHLVRLLRLHRIEVIHAHLTYAVIWGILAARRARIPVVGTLHVAPTDAGGRDAIREWLMMRLLRWSGSTATAVSEAVRKAFLEKYQPLYPTGRGVRGEGSLNIQVIHNGIEVDAFERRSASRSRELKREFEFPTDALVLITVAVLRSGKGIDLLLEALRSIPQARLLVVGDGPLRDQWMQLAQDLGVGELVRWAGYRADVPSLLAGSDLFVLPSLEDAFPTVLLEAMAADLPIVATKAGGIPEIIDSPDVGVLVPPGDVDALAREISALLRDEERRRAIAGAARQRVSEEFSTRTWTDRLMALYRSLR